MNNFSIRFETILVVVLVFLGSFLRLYRFDQLLNFSQEQATAMQLANDMIRDRKPTLIGTPYLSRTTKSNHYFYQSGVYIYPLVPTILLFGPHPLFQTLTFAIYNLLAGVGLYFLARRWFGAKGGCIALFLFMINPTMIEYSRFVWHVSLLVPIMVICLWLVFFLKKTFNFKTIFFLGFWSGLGWGIHLGFTIPVVFFISFLLFKSWKTKSPLALPVYLLGFLVGNLPLLIFEIRHNFFNTRVMLEFLQGIFEKTNHDPMVFTNYHFVSLLVPLFLFAAWLGSKALNKRPVIVITAYLLILLLEYPKWGLTAPTPKGMVNGWNLAGLEKTSKIIAADSSGEYEVASIFDGETRATTLRYLLTYLEEKPPMSVLNYPSSSVIYVTGRQYQNPLDSRAWEITTMQPLRLYKSWPIQNDIYLYKLVRITP